MRLRGTGRLARAALGTWAIWLGLSMAGVAHGQGQVPGQVPGQGPGQGPGAPQWWLGFIDARGHALLELPPDPKACAALAAVLKQTPLPVPGTLIAGAFKAEAAVPPGARLSFGVTDLRGRYAERVMPRVAALAREADRAQGPCWHLVEAGTEAPGYIAEEELIAFGTWPPRRLAVRVAAPDWRSYGDIPAGAGGDARYTAMQEVPAPWRARVDPLLPGYTQVFGQSFEAVLKPGGAPQALTLIGAINDGAGPAGKGEAYNTLNLIVGGAGDAPLSSPVTSPSSSSSSSFSPASSALPRPLYQAGPSGGVALNRAGSFVAQVVAAVDLDGDGVDEIVLRARYFAGGNLKVLKLVGDRLVEIRQTAYDGE